MDTSQTMTREEAARFLGCSTRTLDRWIPPGTPGRTGGDPDKIRPGRTVQIERRLVLALLPTPGGEENHDD